MLDKLPRKVLEKSWLFHLLEFVEALHQTKEKTSV